MTEEIPRIKISRMYQHPRTNAIIVHFEFDIGTRGNINFPASMFEGLTKQQMKEQIWRSLEVHYEEKQREQDSALKSTLKKVVSEMGKEEKR